MGTSVAHATLQPKRKSTAPQITMLNEPTEMRAWVNHTPSTNRVIPKMRTSNPVHAVVWGIFFKSAQR